MLLTPNLGGIGTVSDGVHCPTDSGHIEPVCAGVAREQERKLCARLGPDEAIGWNNALYTVHIRVNRNRLINNISVQLETSTNW